MNSYLLKPGLRQVIGRAGERQVTEVCVDVKEWLEKWPAGRPYMAAMTPGGQRTVLDAQLNAANKMMTAIVPDELMIAPGMYVYQAAWLSGGEQVASDRYDCIVMGSQLAKTWTPHCKAPDWAERIFVAAETIENAMDAVLDIDRRVNPVPDGSLTIDKLSEDLKREVVNNYVTPEMFGAVGDEETDDTDAINAAIQAANEKGCAVYLPGHYYCDGTVKLLRNTMLYGRDGGGKGGSRITSHAEIAMTADGADGAWHVCVKNVQLWGDRRTNTGLVISTNYPYDNADRIGQNWKNMFVHFVVRYFNVGVKFTYSGEDAKCSSENLFLHCKIMDCVTGVFCDNYDSLNNTFIQTDIEAQNPDYGGVPQGPAIHVTNGGGFYFYGCSLIKKGPIVKMSGSLKSCNVNIDSCRIEMLEENPDGYVFGIVNGPTVTGSTLMSDAVLNITGTQLYSHDRMPAAGTPEEEIPPMTQLLIKGEGSGTINISNVNVKYADGNCAMRLTECYDGRNITHKDSGAILYQLNAENVVGAMPAVRENLMYCGQIRQKNVRLRDSGYTAWSELRADYDIIGWTERTSDVHTIRFTRNTPDSVYVKRGFRLPKGVKLLKMGFVKWEQQNTKVIKAKLFAVKDEEDWAGSSFSLATDAELICEVQADADARGYAEAYVSGDHGLEAGASEGFEECRYYLTFWNDTQNAAADARCDVILYYI